MFFGEAHGAACDIGVVVTIAVEQSLDFVHEDDGLTTMCDISFVLDLPEPVGDVAHRLQVRDVADDDEAVHVAEDLAD